MPSIGRPSCISQDTYHHEIRRTPWDILKLPQHVLTFRFQDIVYFEVFAWILFRKIVIKLGLRNFGVFNFREYVARHVLRPNFHGCDCRECRLTREIHED